MDKRITKGAKTDKIDKVPEADGWKTHEEAQADKQQPRHQEQRQPASEANTTARLMTSLTAQPSSPTAEATVGAAGRRGRSTRPVDAAGRRGRLTRLVDAAD